MCRCCGYGGLWYHYVGVGMSFKKRILEAVAEEKRDVKGRDG